MLKIDQVTKSFGEVQALRGLSMHVQKGELYGLLGPNGAGKSTTMALTVGLLEPDSGTVTVNGTGSPEDPAVRAHIGLAPQSLSLYDEMSATENMMFFGQIQGLERRPLKARVGELLERVGLESRASERIQGYSGGMKRRLNLAVALLHSPPLLLLDEPTAGVDPQSRNALFELIRELREGGHTIVYCTHYMEEAQRLCDRVAIIDEGAMLAEGTVDALIEEHGGHSMIQIERASGVEKIETAEPMAEMAKHALAPETLGLRLDRPDLEAVFLRLTGRSLRD
ncbi:MAG: ABC transporter ATP-binding protein [Planctomycetota bacterium]